MIRQLSDYYHDALDGQVVLTKFLNLEEINEINSLNKDGLKVYLYGGYENAERVRAIIQNAYYDEPKKEDYKISIYSATFNENYYQIGHRNVLGSIMSLGIERNTFGDIYIKNNKITLFISEEIEKFMIQHMPMIQRQQLKFIKTNTFDEEYQKEDVKKEIQVASLRLDAIIAKCLNVSRNTACEIIAAGNVSINHLECKNIIKQCKISELISVRKFGRITILEILRTTKKDKLVILVSINH